MDFRNKAIAMYKDNKSVDEISKKIGFTIEEETLKKWVEEDEIKIYKSMIFKLDKKQRYEKNSEKRKSMLVDLQEKIHQILEILPNDADMLIKLMYVNINLKQIDEARKIGYSVLSNNDNNNELLNGLSIVEEISENYDEAIKFIEMILKNDSNNQALKNKLQNIQNKKKKKSENTVFNEKEILYRKIADLERNVRNLTEDEQDKIIKQGKKLDFNKVSKKTYMQVYSQVEKIARQVLQKYPDEIVAREKLVKSLYITNQIEEAIKEGNEVLKMVEEDEIILWYMSKIEKDNGNLGKEKEYLEKILKNSGQRAQIKVQQRLEKVNRIIDQKEKKEEINRMIEEGYTEEDRVIFIDKVQEAFLTGKMTKEDIETKITQARKYPNFNKSIIQLLDLKAQMTGVFQEKVEQLEEYIDNEYSITPEEYDNVLNEIYRTRQQEKQEKKIEEYYDLKEKEERKEKVKEQRDYSKMIISSLNKGKLDKKDLPVIVKKLESFEDRARSIFLITKLYEIFYGKEEAYKNLIKYTKICDLSENERRQIVGMQLAITDKKEIKSRHKINGAISNKENLKYKKDLQKSEIMEYLNQHKTVKEIYTIMSKKGVSLKSIARVKSFYIKDNLELQEEYKRLEKYAENLLVSGYKVQEIYQIMEYDIPIPKLNELSQRIIQKNQNQLDR